MKWLKKMLARGGWRGAAPLPDELHKAGYYGGATALDLLAAAVEKLPVGTTSADARAGAEAMRRAVVEAAREAAAAWRGQSVDRQPGPA